MKIGNAIVNEVVELSQTRITIQHKKYKLVDKLVEVINEHIILPESCKAGSSYCQTSSNTYIWDKFPSKCNLHITKQVEMQDIGNGYLVDEEQQLVLRKLQQLPSPRGCPLDPVWKTEYNNIFLTTSKEFPKIDPVNIDTLAYIRALNEFSIYAMGKRTLQSRTKISQNLCSAKFDIPLGNKLHFDKDVFISRAGDLITMIKCVPRISTIKAQKKCYKDIPIEDGFIDIKTRLFKQYSAPRSCTNTQIIKAREAWVSMGTVITRVMTPDILPEKIRKSPTHLDLAGGSLYTQVELDKWKQESAQEDYHQATLQSLTFGLCINQGTCEAGSQEQAPNYSLKSLIPAIPVLPNIFEKVNMFITTWGGWLSAIVLVLEGIKLLTFITIWLTTIWREGIQGCNALLYMVCYSTHSSMTKIARRARKMQYKTDLEYVEAAQASPFIAESRA